jgi:anti-sigma regulatory factor (Ser/Thr protein kinase)
VSRPFGASALEPTSPLSDGVGGRGDSSVREPVSRVFPPATASAAAARRFVGAALCRWEVDPDVAELACLLTSELITNACRHARSRARVSVLQQPEAVRVEVHDRGGGPVRVGHPKPEQEGGRGLHIVDALASRWGSTASEGGTLVWFEFPTGR